MLKHRQTWACLQPQFPSGLIEYLYHKKKKITVLIWNGTIGNGLHSQLLSFVKQFHLTQSNAVAKHLTMWLSMQNMGTRRSIVMSFLTDTIMDKIKHHRIKPYKNRLNKTHLASSCCSTTWISRWSLVWIGRATSVPVRFSRVHRSRALNHNRPVIPPNNGVPPHVSRHRLPGPVWNT